MKKLVLLLVVIASFSTTAQTKSELQKHFEAYYKQMKQQGDVQGVINAMTHLEALKPSQARKDTIAYLYVSENMNVEALNTIGIEKNANDSDLNVEVKALALKALNQPKRALEHYEVMFSRKPSPYLAYEIADIKIQLQDLPNAKTSIEYGLANVKDDMKYAFYESQQPYETSLKAALIYLKALVIYNEDTINNVESALATLNHALVIDPKFNLAKISKDALLKKTKQ
jgi:tetratricopeptide (TPR) repeat protein